VKKRTPKDEIAYDEHLRQEGPIKSEVIVHLRDENKSLMAMQYDILKTLVETTALLQLSLTALQRYREDTMRSLKTHMSIEHKCSTMCRTHYWDTETGWRRKE